MANLTLPMPVVVAGAAMCLLAGALVGYVSAPHAQDHTLAKVVSYDQSSSRLCLGGDSVKDQPGLDARGDLCGTWRRAGVDAAPRVGQSFRYVVVRTSGTRSGRPQQQVLIYGDVVR